MVYWLYNNWLYSLLIINYLVALSAAFFLIRSNQNPRKTLSSLLFLVALPFVGLAIYYFFGLEYRKSKIFKRKELISQKLIREWNDRLHISSEELSEYENDFLGDRVKLVKLLHHNQAATLTLKNDLKVLTNGEQTFNCIFKDLDRAKDHIHLEYFIIQDDDIGTQFIDKLIAARKRGVEVKLIYDSVGSDISKKATGRMKEAGIEFHAFMPVLFSKLTRKANYRNHRKICIVDGHIGYLGGINISDDYINSKDESIEKFWRDTHLRIEGHAVKSMQLHWLLNWYFVNDQINTQTDLVIPDSYFPEIDEKENKPVQIAASGPDSEWANIMQAIFMAIATAAKSVYITTPYLIPNEAILTALKSAARAGIDVVIMVPKEGDSWAARYASRSYFREILESGIKLHWYHPGMLHSKTIVVDNEFATIGTSNMDYRSFNINFEINALIFDKEISEELSEQFFIDLKHCEQVVIEKWLKRNNWNKMKESFCRLWAPLL